MPTDRDRSRRHYDASARRKPSAVPVAIDPADELTPPPQEPPRLPVDDSIPPPIMQRLDMLAEGLGQATSAIGRVWEVRNLGPQVEQLSARVESVAADVSACSRDIVEASTRLRGWETSVKSLMARTDAVASYVDQTRGRQAQFWEQDWPRLCAAIEKLDKRLDDVGERISRVERTIESHQYQVDDVRSHIGRIEDFTKGLDLRITVVDKRTTALERRNLEADAGDRRQTKLLSLARAGIVALVAAISTLATLFLKD